MNALDTFKKEYHDALEMEENGLFKVNPYVDYQIHWYRMHIECI